MKKVYLVLKNADWTEGRGPMHPHALFSTYSAAKCFVTEKGGAYKSDWQGWWSIEEIFLCDNVTEFEVSEKEVKKQKALDKLSQEEKELLGLV